MNTEFRKILDKIDNKEISIPKNLVDNIVLRIEKESHKEAKLRAISLSLVSVTSLLISIPIISSLITSFTQSGFYNYLSIIFSDSDVAITYWKEILMSLAESLPVIGITSLFVVMAIFTWSTIKAASETKTALQTA